MEINAAMGEAGLDAFPAFRVDVKDPEIMLRIEVREKIYVYSVDIPGAGGMPIGTGGKGMLLLSGGIDSPVAGAMMAKRGVELVAVHFASPPYTSPRAEEKVHRLLRQVSRYSEPVEWSEDAAPESPKAPGVGVEGAGLTFNGEQTSENSSSVPALNVTEASTMPSAWNAFLTGM